MARMMKNRFLAVLSVNFEMPAGERERERVGWMGCKEIGAHFSLGQKIDWHGGERERAARAILRVVCRIAKEKQLAYVCMWIWDVFHLSLVFPLHIHSNYSHSRFVIARIADRSDKSGERKRERERESENKSQRDCISIQKNDKLGKFTKKLVKIWYVVSVCIDRTYKHTHPLTHSFHDSAHSQVHAKRISQGEPVTQRMKNQRNE